MTRKACRDTQNKSILLKVLYAKVVSLLCRGERRGERIFGFSAHEAAPPHNSKGLGSKAASWHSPHYYPIIGGHHGVLGEEDYGQR